jgi:large subunit ribosomal protein L25
MDYKLQAKLRDPRVTKLNQLRATGAVPAVAYGHKNAPEALTLDGTEFRKVFQRAGRSHLVDLHVDGGRAQKVLIREVQIHPRVQGAVHVDLYRIDAREKLTVEVPVHLTGESPAVKLGLGDLLVSLHNVKVECLPGDIPEKIEASIEGLTEVDATIRVQDLAVPADVSILNDPDDVVAKVHAHRVVEVDEPVAEAAAPEGEEDAEASAPEEESEKP